MSPSRYSDPYDWEFQEFLRLSEEEPQRRKASMYVEIF